jgi:hypothetical protein
LKTSYDKAGYLTFSNTTTEVDNADDNAIAEAFTIMQDLEEGGGAGDVVERVLTSFHTALVTAGVA